MVDPTETPLPALWQRFLDQVADRARAMAPAGEAGDPYRALQLYLDIEERAVRLAALLVDKGIVQPTYYGITTGATVIAQQLRIRLGLPADPPNLDSRPEAGLP